MPVLNDVRRVAFPADITARRRHEESLVEVPAPHPAPAIGCRLAATEEIPAGAQKIQAVAEEYGWRVQATYCRGTVIKKGRRPPLPKGTTENTEERKARLSAPAPPDTAVLVDSLALRMRRGTQAAVAVWQDGKYEMGVIWGATQHPKPALVMALRAYLMQDPIESGKE